MTYPAHFPRPVVLRARRDTVVLVVAATTLTLALSHVVHRHRDAAQTTAVRQAWTGGLADVAAPRMILASTEPLTSESLVVPKSELALPEPTLGPLVSMRGCGGQSCTPKAAVPQPVRRAVADDEMETVVVPPTPRRHQKPSFMARLNPLNHLPDASVIKRPFVFAGDTVSGWFKRF